MAIFGHRVVVRVVGGVAFGVAHEPHGRHSYESNKRKKFYLNPVSADLN